MRTYYILIFGLLFSYTGLFVACHHSNSPAHDHPADQEQETGLMNHEEENILHLTQIQMEHAGIETGSFERKVLKTSLKVTGKLELPPQNQARVGSLMGGRINSIRIRPGQYVKKGQLLATLENPEFISLQQEYFESLNHLKLLKKEFDRQQLLSEQKISTSKLADKAESAYKAEEIRLVGLESRLSLLNVQAKSLESIRQYLPVYAPISGHITTIQVRMGEYVPTEKDLFGIVDNHHVHIDFWVYESDIDQIQLDQEIQFFLQNKPDQILSANIFSIGKAMEEEERAILVHAEIENEKGYLIPGMYVEGRIILNETEKELCVPIQAIATDNGLFYIFELLDEEEEEEKEIHFKKIQVIKGATDYGFVEVKVMEEISPKASIVVNGAFFLMAQSKKDQAGEMHHH